MSGTIHNTAFFPSRKRRSGGEAADGLKLQESKRPFAAGEKQRDSRAGSSSSSSSASSSTAALPSFGIVAGAVAPKSTDNGYVQEAIHKEVQYSPEGKSKHQVPANTLKVFRFVEEAFVIPSDFEKDHKFGPLSGMSHEVRVVSAFMAGQLEPRSEEAKAGVKMCLECGGKGHFPRHCPVTLLHQ
ncbi:unnamed protein product [Scytosiphon promiscuus]